MRALLGRQLPGAPPKVVDLIAHLCAPDPTMRPATAKQALAEIEELRTKVGEGKSLKAIVRARAPTGSLASERTDVGEKSAVIPMIAIGLFLVTAVVAAIVYALLTS